MAERVTVELVDDLDGSVADETVHFTWVGKSLVIDLNKKNGDKLRKAIEPFVAAASRMGQCKPQLPVAGFQASHRQASARTPVQEPPPASSGRGQGRTASRFPTVAA